MKEQRSLSPHPTLFQKHHEDKLVKNNSAKCPSCRPWCDLEDTREAARQEGNFSNSLIFHDILGNENREKKDKKMIIRRKQFKPIF